jgi:hypothetical protein
MIASVTSVLHGLLACPLEFLVELLKADGYSSLSNIFGCHELRHELPCRSSA